MAYGQCDVDENGRPISGPSYSLEKRVTLDGQEVRVTVGDGVTPESLTDLIIAKGNAHFEARFKHPPTEMPGLLTEDNAAIFQRAYLAELDAKVPVETAKVNAVLKTPFGVARARAKYDQVEVRPFKEMKLIVYGDPPRVREVPAKIDVIMRKK